MAWSVENGILDGIGTITDGTFDPDKQITRQEMAVMLLNFAEHKGYEVPVNREMPNYADYQQIDMWAENAAKKLSEADVLSGDAGKFEPHR